MKNLPLLLVTLFGTLALIIGVAVYFSSTTGKQQVVDQAQLVGNPQYVRGATTSAQVTIVEFSDFQCPACKAVHPLVQQVLQTHPDKVRLVYRHFPLTNIHPYAVTAAQAAEAAGEQGKFWEMHDLLFARQEAWSQLASVDEAQAEFVKYAEELAIDKDTFLATIQSDTVKKRVAEDMALGGELRISATPTLFVNGQKVAAPQQLMTTVESYLK